VNTTLVTAGIAAGGWIVAIVTLVQGFLERRAAREEDRLGKTLDYFDGGSQRRSIGISLIEGIWLSKPRYRDIIVPLISNQVVYLLLSSDSHDAHNERNLVRLVMILTKIPNFRERYHDRWGDVCNAIFRKFQGEPKGIPIFGPTLQLWWKSLGNDMALEKE
jgi:hypothetical protein